jgi:hypothetical protein
VAFRWLSWRGLLCFVALAALARLTAWGAENAWISNHEWIPGATWIGGLILLLLGRPRRIETERRSMIESSLGWLLILYVIAFGPIDPMASLLVDDTSRQPMLNLLLIPIAWAGVVGLRRGAWKWAIGAWLVLYGQFFALIYNVSHGTSGIGCWMRWVE